MGNFKFVHSSDLHLGSPFKGLLGMESSTGNRLLEAGFEAFQNILRICVQNKVDFLLIAGDVFDAEDRGLKAQIRFRDGLAELAEKGIRSFVVHGNHDPLSGWAAQLEWPEGVKIFGDRIETAPVTREGEILCHIQGISYPKADIRENLSRNFKRPPASPFAIALLHANLGTGTGHEPYAPCSIEDLDASGFDYWALGHVHKAGVIRKEKPAIVYPGNPQGLHINESGRHGIYLATVTNGHLTDLSFLPTDVVRWFNLTGESALDISSIETEEELLGLIDAQCEKINTEAEDRSAIVRLELRGRAPLHSHLCRETYLEDLKSALQEKWIHKDSFLFLERIGNNTRLPVNLEAHRKAGDFIAEILELIDQARTSPDFLEALKKEHLSPLYESRLWPPELSPPSESELRDILNEVEILLVDQLIGEEPS
ncbi:DNA repair exonuclease [Candidatus Sumerlaeota bacterium]|nr:DNA repair exonuclease [Candidatus Sumerlaeota bacterium]